MIVRPERSNDVDAVREVVRAAFGEESARALLDELVAEALARAAERDEPARSASRPRLPGSRTGRSRRDRRRRTART
jgi:hypothetical protein